MLEDFIEQIDRINKWSNFCTQFFVSKLCCKFLELPILIIPFDNFNIELKSEMCDLNGILFMMLFNLFGLALSYGRYNQQNNDSVE